MVNVITTRELFQQHGLRCTRQRIALYEALRKARNHPTADELYRLALQHDPEAARGLSRATVYNTLEALGRAGLVHQVPNAGACCRYDADLTDHLHFRCRETAEIRDVPPELGQRLLDRLPRKIVAQIEREMGVHIEGLNIQLVGRVSGNGH
jgi:Fur family peroxide stress response transcriptional regulator